MTQSATLMNLFAMEASATNMLALTVLRRLLGVRLIYKAALKDLSLALTQDHHTIVMEWKSEVKIMKNSMFIADVEVHAHFMEIGKLLIAGNGANFLKIESQ